MREMRLVRHLFQLALSYNSKIRTVYMRFTKILVHIVGGDF